MAKPFSELRAKMSPDAQKRARAAAEELIKDMALQELRSARQTTQENLARVLHVNQAAISKLERRTDMYISTLRSYIEAMGGELEIIARFNDQAVRLKQFEDLDAETSASHQ
jgi:transcriptional regulator with XRE-family HTH domain